MLGRLHVAHPVALVREHLQALPRQPAHLQLEGLLCLEKSCDEGFRMAEVDILVDESVHE